MSPPIFDTVLIPISIVSVVASLSVVFTLLLFHDMRSKFFMQIIAYISISDAIGNCAYMVLYRPPTGNWWCTLQGILNYTMYPISWLWTLALVYHLYCVAITGHLPSKHFIRYTHIICWGVPWALTLIGLSVTHYARSAPIGFEVCFLDSDNAAIYHGVTYYGLLIVVLISLGVIVYKTSQLEKTKTDVNTLHPSYSVLKSSVTLYPTALVICWIPHVILFSLYEVEQNHFTVYEWFYFAVTILKILHGAITAVIFFYKSESARRHWIRWLHYYCCCLCPSFCDLQKTRQETMSSSQYDEYASTENPVRYSFQVERPTTMSADVT